MSESIPMQVIARLHSDFTQKFGIPRQSGLVDELEATVVFEPEFRSPDALRGIEGFSHLWLIWEFSQARRPEWSPTVRPPRLGGNVRMGVFATRSPFRPNPIGLSCVRLAGVELHSELGPILKVRGADLLDGTPIFDIKPYVPYADSKPQALGGFASAPKEATLAVDIPRSCWSASHPRSGRPSPACWPRTPGPPTRRTRPGSTAWASAAWTSNSGWRGTGSRWWPWSLHRNLIWHSAKVCYNWDNQTGRARPAPGQEGFA